MDGDRVVKLHGDDELIVYSLQELVGAGDHSADNPIISGLVCRDGADHR
jgi:hypothetical protein